MEVLAGARDEAREATCAVFCCGCSLPFDATTDFERQPDLSTLPPFWHHATRNDRLHDRRRRLAHKATLLAATPTSIALRVSSASS